MNKKYLEIILALSSIILFIILVSVSKMLLESSAGYGYAASLLIFICMMGLSGLKLAQIPDK